MSWEETEGLRGWQQWPLLHTGVTVVPTGGATESADGGEGPYNDAGAEGGGHGGELLVVGAGGVLVGQVKDGAGGGSKLGTPDLVCCCKCAAAEPWG